MTDTLKARHADLLACERAMARAWPAGEVRDVDGWQVRLSGGGSRRANSLLPLAFTGADVGRALDRVETIYSEHGLPAYVYVSAIAAPADLDTHLAGRGYAREEPTILLAKPLGAIAPLPDIEAAATPGADWLGIYAADLSPDRRTAAPGVLARVPNPRRFFLLRQDGVPASTALGVIVGDIAVVECVATDPGRRRKGGARRVVAALEQWAFAAGATRVALQVTAGNAAARQLYEQAGYRFVAQHHYRVRGR